MGVSNYKANCLFLNCRELIWKLEAPATIQEIEAAIDVLKMGKVPSPDGLKAAFYKRFKTQLAPYLYQVFINSQDGQAQ